MSSGRVDKSTGLSSPTEPEVSALTGFDPSRLRDVPQGFDRPLFYDAMEEAADFIELLLKRLRGLERAASEVQRLGAQTGPQWPRLGMEIMLTRAAIATETRRAETTKIGSVEDEGAGRQASPNNNLSTQGGSAAQEAAPSNHGDR